MFKAPNYSKRKSPRAAPNYLRNFTRVTPRHERARNAWGHNPLELLRYIAFRDVK